jgi:hypothetical protein
VCLKNYQASKSTSTKVSFLYGEAKNHEKEYTQLFGCEMGQYPFRYLGILMHHKKISNTDWKIIEDKIEKKQRSWKGKFLSYVRPIGPNQFGVI